jgi:FixJ family two-component response regulator
MTMMTQKLSEREIQVLKLVAAGLNNRAIATELRISRRTVETHRAKMRMRLQLDTEELIQYALQTGILKEEEKGANAINEGEGAPV